VSDAEAQLLRSRPAPIVLLRRRADAAISLAHDVTPGLPEIGVMLPYSPLHHLLLVDRPLVMTSGNRSDEPICTDDEEALRTLADIADDFLLHDRAIHVHCDDSVARIFRGGEMPIRRSRGYAPHPVRLPAPAPTILAVGGELKATFCLTRDDHAFLSQHIGDMGSLATLEAFERAAQHFITIFRARPQLVACDMHPGYLSTQWAERFASSHGLPLRRVQHHHAHVAAVLAEHRCAPDRRVIGLVCDGTGYGDDGAIWGCEVFAASAVDYERLAHLRYSPLPGGDAAIRHPFRSALAHLWDAGIDWDDDLPCAAACDAQTKTVLRRQLERNLHCARSSSLGRLFDALASLLGVRHSVTYEAQAAVELQALAECAPAEDSPWDVPTDLDARPLLHAAVRDVRAGVDRARIARRAHTAVARMLVHACVAARERTHLETVALSGGVFQNTLLLEDVLSLLDACGFEMLWHRAVPSNDGGIALGQALIAANAPAAAKVGST
jgi:hydrogenase maturation protein HypF